MTDPTPGSSAKGDAVRTAKVVLGFAILVTRWKSVCHDGKWETEVVVELFRNEFFLEKPKAVQTAVALRKKLVKEWNEESGGFLPRPRVAVRKALRYRRRVIAL